MRLNLIWSMCLATLLLAAFAVAEDCVKYEEGKITATCDPNKPLDVSAEFPGDQFNFTVGYSGDSQANKGDVNTAFVTGGDCKFTILKETTDAGTNFHVLTPNGTVQNSRNDLIVKKGADGLEFYNGLNNLGSITCSPDFKTSDGKHLLKFSVTFDKQDQNLYIQLEKDAKFVKDETTPAAGSGSLGAIVGGCVGSVIFVLIIVGGILVSSCVPAIGRRMPCKCFRKKEQVNAVVLESVPTVQTPKNEPKPEPKPGPDAQEPTERTEPTQRTESTQRTEPDVDDDVPAQREKAKPKDEPKVEKKQSNPRASTLAAKQKEEPKTAIELDES